MELDQLRVGLLLEHRAAELHAVLLAEPLDLAVPDAMQVFEEITRYRLLHGVLPVDGLLPQPELNAWIAAHVACLASTQPEALRPVNQDQGGCVYLPFPTA